MSDLVKQFASLLIIPNFRHIVTRDFVLLNICFVFGFSPIFLFFLFPLHLKEIGAQEHQIGIAMGIFSLGALVSKPLAGRWMDSRGRKEVTFTGYLLAIASLIPMCYIHSIPVYYILRFIFGVGMSFCLTGIYTILLDISKPQMIGQAVGLFGIANFVVSGTATIVGEYLYSRFGFGIIFVLSIFNLLVSFLFFLFIKLKQTDRSEIALPFFQTMIGKVRGYVFATCMFGAVHGVLNSFITVYLRENGFKQVSLFFVFYALGAILMRIFFGYMVDKGHRPTIIIVNFIIYSGVIAVIACFPFFIPVFIAAFIGGASHGFLFPAINTGVIKIIGDKWRGTSTSIFFTAFDLGLGAAPFLFGFLAGTAGYSLAFLTTAIVLFFYSLMSYKPLDRTL